MARKPFSLDLEDESRLCRNRSYSSTMRQRARTLRKTQTAAEQLLWRQLRASQLGIPFRRQHIIDTYIIDFYAPSCCLGIELDGGIHRRPQQQDLHRQESLSAKGITVIRFSNDEVMADIAGVVARIRDAITARMSSPHPRPFPPEGRGTAIDTE